MKKFVVRALFGVRAPFTIHVAVTILGRCLLMDHLFQIISNGLFVSDNIRFIQLLQMISFQCMHGDQFCNDLFVSDTNEYQSNCDLL